MADTWVRNLGTGGKQAVWHRCQLIIFGRSLGLS